MPNAESCHFFSPHTLHFLVNPIPDQLLREDGYIIFLNIMHPLVLVIASERLNFEDPSLYQTCYSNAQFCLIESNHAER